MTPLSGLRRAAILAGASLVAGAMLIVFTVASLPIEVRELAASPRCAAHASAGTASHPYILTAVHVLRRS